MNLLETPHFKLYARIEQTIVLNAALYENDIEFLKEENPVGIHIRYYFKDEDAEVIDKISKELGLELSTETIVDLDYNRSKTYYKFYAIAILAAILLVLLLSFFS